MAEEFDPDAYLSKPFDPDAYLGVTGGSSAQSSAPMAWTDVGIGAAKNFGPSALEFGKNVVQPFIHPIETADAFKNLGHGILQKTGVLSGDDHEKYADAVGRFFADRYGGIENVKHTLATDPVGLAADLSVLVTGGGGLAARAPGMVGKVGQVTKTAGQLIDPINIAAKGAGLSGKLVAGTIGNLGTHTGRESIETAFRAGLEGGESAKAFRENMRGTAPMEETVEAAREGLNKLRTQRGTAYRNEMSKIGADKTILDFDEIDRAFLTSGVKRFKGVDISTSTAGLRSKIMDIIDDWRRLDPAEFHTAEGLDALKQKIGDLVYGTTEAGTPARVVGDQIYKSIKQTIAKQAPQYSKVMDAYETATREIREIERTLSLPGDHAATVDTSLRKLQSVLRDNVNTSFGRRRELAQYLIEAGSPQLMERLAGQALKPGAPRGLGRLAMNTMVEGLLLLAGGVASGGAGLTALAPAAASLPFMSPRLMGEAAYGLGRAASPSKYITVRPRMSYQVGRLSRIKPVE